LAIFLIKVNYKRVSQDVSFRWLRGITIPSSYKVSFICCCRWLSNYLKVAFVFILYWIISLLWGTFILWVDKKVDLLSLNWHCHI
jgi:hypothetical protein